MKIGNIKSKKMIEGLCAYVMELDPLRPPLIFSISSQSLRTLFELLFKQRQKSYFIKNNPTLHEKILKEMQPYRTNTEVNSKEVVLVTTYLIITIFSILAISAIITVIYSLSLLYGSLTVIIIALPNLYLFFSFIITRRRRFLGEKYNENIKTAVQELINYGIEFIKKESLNPENYPLKLRHDDYKGLFYEKNGESNYIGYFK